MARTNKKRAVARFRTPHPSMSMEAQGRRIRACLKIRGWTPKRLAEQLGRSQGYISKLLNPDTSYAKKSSLHASDAWDIARALGLTEMYILYGERKGLPDDILRQLPPED